MSQCRGGKKRSKTSDYHHLSSPLIVVRRPPLRCLNYITAEPPSIYIFISRYLMMKCSDVCRYILCTPRKPCTGGQYCCYSGHILYFEWVYTRSPFPFHYVGVRCECIINFSCLLALKHYVLYSQSMISAQLQLTVLIRHYQELNDIILLFVSLLHNSEQYVGLHVSRVIY